MAEDVCRYCGVARHPPERCPRVSAIEYAQIDGAIVIKRIEFHAPRPAMGADVELSIFDRVFGRSR